MKQSIIFLIVILQASVFAGDVEIGIALMKAGKFDESCQYIHRAYANNPSIPKTQFAYALTEADGMKAKKIYKNIAENKTASNSLRAEACNRLGAFYYCKEDYDKARVFYSKAEKHSQKDKYRHMKALAIFNKGDSRTAESLWLSMVSVEKEKGSADKVRYYLGNAFYQQGNYEQAYNCYNPVSESGKREWVAPALIGAHLSAFHRGDTERSAILFEKIQKEYPSLLEKELLNAGEAKSVTIVEVDIGSRDDFGAVEEDIQWEDVVPPEEKIAQDKIEPQKEGNPRNGQYTLQVGAFGAIENAQKLQKEMKNHFDYVTVKEEIVRGIKYLKVRVGSFEKEEEALTYGEKHLRRKDIPFRVVKK